ncbi:hypothetical protein Scep_016442 [Stephania cephalantha]|uniref:Uncharacterized protein n=1 Tax=Stephania cephalantha TaxID=152367 RepID=A0AAP0IMM8_9MAGN
MGELIESQAKLMALLMAQMGPLVQRPEAQPITSPEVSKAEGGPEIVAPPVQPALQHIQVPETAAMVPVDSEKAVFLKTRKEFIKYDIMRFNGTIEEGVAETWILEMEQQLVDVDVEDQFKVKLVIFLLIDSARKW